MISIGAAFILLWMLVKLLHVEVTVAALGIGIGFILVELVEVLLNRRIR